MVAVVAARALPPSASVAAREPHLRSDVACERQLEDREHATVEDQELAALSLLRQPPASFLALPWTAASQVRRWAAAPERSAQFAHLAWYSRHLEEHRQRESEHLGTLAYLDHAGAALYSRQQVFAAERALTGVLLANPHSLKATEEAIANARLEMLKMLGSSPDTHTLIFTSGVSHALDLIGECFAWPDEGALLVCAREGLAEEAAGLRRRAHSAGAACASFGLDDLSTLCCSLEAVAPVGAGGAASREAAGANLLLLPCECGLTGVRADLRHVAALRSGPLRWRVALDASRLIANGPGLLDLGDCPADFVVMSFHQIFGLPTGLGALVVRHDAAPLLAPRTSHGGDGGPTGPHGPAYFAGGCVAAVSAASTFAVPRPGLVEWLERGTPHFEGIAVLSSQLACLRQLGHAQMLRGHALAVYREAYVRMRGLSHATGRSVCAFWGRHEDSRWPEVQGPTIAFALHWSDGSRVPPSDIVARARARGVVLHACPDPDLHHTHSECQGSCASCTARSSSSLSRPDVGRHMAAARISFGPLSTMDDVGRWVALLHESFVDQLPPAGRRGNRESSGGASSSSAPWPREGVPQLPSAQSRPANFHVRQALRELRAKEFGHLGRVAYLDYAGAALYSREQARAVSAALLDGFLASPASSADTAAVVKLARAEMLGMFGASPETHALVFTSGATRALQLVGERFPWQPGSLFLCAGESHTSALGLRQLARGRGALCGTFELDALQELCGNLGAAAPLPVDSDCTAGWPEGALEAAERSQNLLVLPGESNFSGARADLEQVAPLRGGRPRWRVLLDAAKLACSPGVLDLSGCPADFVALSFYKIFGYPTGLGALIVHKDALPLLAPPGSCGMAAEAALEDLEPGADAHFQGIASLPRQLALAREIGSDDERHKRVLAVCREAYERTSALRHAGGRPLCTIFGRHDDEGWMDAQGPTIALVLSWSDGSPVPYGLVLERAQVHGIVLRAGCHCNAGSCQRYLGISDADVRRFFSSGKVCGDDLGVIEGRHTGVVRISFGLFSLEEDVDRWITLLEEEFLDRVEPRAPLALAAAADVPLDAQGLPSMPSGPRRQEAATASPDRLGAGRAAGSPLGSAASASGGRVVGLKIYPVKGCGPLRVRRWPMDPASGALLLDRRWCLAVGGSESSRPRHVSAKQAPRLTQVRFALRLRPGTEPALVLSAKGLSERMLLPLSPVDAEALHQSSAEAEAEESAVNGDASLEEDGFGFDSSAEPVERIARWFEALLRLPRLRLLEASVAPGPMAGAAAQQHFANGPGTLLLVSTASLQEFGHLCGLDVPADRFRANLEVDYEPAFAEAGWQKGQEVRLGTGACAVAFDAAGRCVRCQAVDIDPEDATATGPSLLAALATVRPGSSLGETSGPTFGVLLRLRGTAAASPAVLWLGMAVSAAAEGL